MKIQEAINLALDKFKAEDLLKVFITEAKQRKKTNVIKDVVTTFAKDWYELIDPTEGQNIVIPLEKLSMVQYDRIKEFLETEIFTCHNEQQSLYL
jgi:uncharacterized protein YvpB